MFRFLTLCLLIAQQRHWEVNGRSLSHGDVSISGGREPDNDEGTLLFAAILYRHGDRSPIDPYPSDPYNSPMFWNHTDWGQLSNAGKEQHFELGQWLRRRYNSLVNETYNLNDIWVRSTDVDRALMSAQSNLAGFYPPKEWDVWNEPIQWQPIPVHTTPTKEDKLIYMGAKCPRYDYEYRKYMQSDAHKALKKKYKATFDYLTKYTNKTVNSFRTANQVWGVMVIEEIHNMPLPEWTKEVYPHPLTEMSAISFQTPAITTPMARLRSGPLLKDILKGMRQKFAGKLEPNRGVWMYSGHDTTVADLLTTLRLFDPPSNPPFTATVLMELWNVAGKPYVKLFYKKGPTDLVSEQLEIPGCGKVCPLEKMFEVYADVLPDNWDEECKLGTWMMSYEEAQIGSAIVPMTVIPATVFLLSILFLLLVVAAVVVNRRRAVLEPTRTYHRMET